MTNPVHQTADAIREVTSAVQTAIDEGYRSRAIDADDVVEILLAIADRLDPPLADVVPEKTTWFVATIARYVLVEAEDETTARELGRAALYDLYADAREQQGQDVPINIQTVRHATDTEIGLWRWHHEMLSREAGQQNG